MTDDRGNMSFSDPQLEFFNFDALSDDEVQRIKNVLKQPCSAVELPDIPVCTTYKDQVNNVPADYKNVQLAINMDYSHQVANTYATMSQPHMYSVANTVNGTTYITGYAMPGTNMYVASPTQAPPRKDYMMGKMMNGMEGMENGGGGNMGEAMVDPNGVTGMMMSNLYPAHWPNVYPCPTYVLSTMPTFFTPIAPVHATGIRAATSTVSMCGENVIPATITPSMAPPTTYVTVAAAPVAMQPTVVADIGTLQPPPHLPHDISPIFEEQREVQLTETTEMFYENKDVVEFGNAGAEEQRHEEKPTLKEIETEARIEEEITTKKLIATEPAPQVVNDVPETVIPAPAVASNKTWASLFKGKSTRGEQPLKTTTFGSQASPAASQVFHPAVASPNVNCVPEKVSNGENTVKTTKFEAEERDNNQHCHANGVFKEQDLIDRNLGELLVNMKVDQRPINVLPRGLFNKGNWCYINATLQALLACPPFYNLLSKLPNVIGLQSESSNCPITDCMVEFVNEFSLQTYTGGVTNISRKKDDQMSVTVGHPFEPIYIYNAMSKVKSHAFEGRQEDAEEFLSCLLNRLHDEMLAALSKVEKEVKEINGNAEEQSEDDVESWTVIEKGNKCSTMRSTAFSPSPISDIFCGRIRSVLQSVSGLSQTVQPFFSLQLDIQSDNIRTVKDALIGLVTKENLQDYHCSKTKQEVAASRQITLDELPPILILHLKRFVYDKDGGSQKLSKKLDFKIDLEFGKELLSSTAKGKLGSSKQKLYKLNAVVYHCGREAVKGHYVADVYHHGSNCWLRADDTRLTVVQESEVLNHLNNLVPYMFFYRRLDDFSANNAK